MTSFRPLARTGPYPESIAVDARASLAIVLDGSLEVWDVDATTKLTELDGHLGYTASVAVTPVGDVGVTGGDDETVRTWDLRSGREIAALSTGFGVLSLAVTPDGGRVLVGGDDQTLGICSLPDLRWLRGFTTHVAGRYPSALWDVASDPDGTRAASAGDDQCVCLWDLVSGEQIAVLRGHDDLVAHVRWTMDGTRVISGGPDNTVRVWDARSGRPIRQLAAKDDVLGLASLPDGRCLMAVGSSVRIHDVETGLETGRLEPPGDPRQVTTIATSADGSRLLLAVEGGQVWVVDDVDVGDQNQS